MAIVGDVIEEDFFAGETVLPIIRAIPHIGNGIGQSPTVFVIIIERVAAIWRSGIGTMPRGVSILHGVQPGIGVAVVIEQIGRVGDEAGAHWARD